MSYVLRAVCPALREYWETANGREPSVLEDGAQLVALLCGAWIGQHVIMEHDWLDTPMTDVDGWVNRWTRPAARPVPQVAPVDEDMPDEG